MIPYFLYYEQKKQHNFFDIEDFICYLENPVNEGGYRKNG